MTFDIALKRAITIEGVAEIAFLRLSNAMKSGELLCRASRKQQLFFGFGDEEISEFDLNDEFWENVYLNHCGNDKVVFERIEAFAAEGDEEYTPDGREAFDPDRWQISILTEAFERVFQPADAKPLDHVIQKRKGAGGRPTKFDWARAGAVAAAYVVENDYPSDKARLADHLVEWFTGEKSAPERREIERFVDQLVQEGARLATGRKI